MIDTQVLEHEPVVRDDGYNSIKNTYILSGVACLCLEAKVGIVAALSEPVFDTSKREPTRHQNSRNSSKISSKNSGNASKSGGGGGRGNH